MPVAQPLNELTRWSYNFYQSNSFKIDLSFWLPRAIYLDFSCVCDYVSSKYNRAAFLFREPENRKYLPDHHFKFSFFLKCSSRFRLRRSYWSTFLNHRSPFLRHHLLLTIAQENSDPLALPFHSVLKNIL